MTDLGKPLTEWTIEVAALQAGCPDLCIRNLPPAIFVRTAEFILQESREVAGLRQEVEGLRKQVEHWKKAYKEKIYFYETPGSAQ